MSGELKHGVLALVDENLPIIMILTRDHLFSKSQNAYQQGKSRQCSNLQTDCLTFGSDCARRPPDCDL